MPDDGKNSYEKRTPFFEVDFIGKHHGHQYVTDGNKVPTDVAKGVAGFGKKLDSKNNEYEAWNDGI
jgi:hypothetical protein